MEKNEKLAQLTGYIQRGFPILPLHWMVDGQCSCKKDCHSNGKHPLTQHGFKDASTDLDQVMLWHSKFPEANWGIATGAVSMLVVIDVDVKTNGNISWEQLVRENPGTTNTITVSSGGGGRHYWFRQPEELDIPSSQGKLAPGIDVRGNNGYIIVPPSRTLNEYRFLSPFESTPISEMPGWIIDLIMNAGQSEKGTRTETIPQGKRHKALISEGLRLKHSCSSAEELFNKLKMYCEVECEYGDHPVKDEEIWNIVTWIMENGLQHPLTDLGNAERFYEQHGEHIRWCEDTGKWLIWNGKIWVSDNKLEIVKLAHDTIRSIGSEAGVGSDSEQLIIKKHALSSESSLHIRAMIDNAKPYLAISMSEFENDPYLLNVENGILNLKTGAITPHQSDQFFGRYIDIPFDPSSTCPKWENFLAVIAGEDQDLIAFLQRAVGYSLTGVTDEQCFFFIYGRGRNGKTTFIETLHMIFGEYSTKTDAKLLTDDKYFNDKQYAAQLVGIRLVSANEVSDMRKMNESVVKDLTGGDIILARSLYREPFSFKPSHKLWMYGNYKPQIVGQDEGIWRRIKIIPFVVSIPPEINKPQSALFQDFKSEAPGILAWAVRGCLEWQRHGLGFPQKVVEATAEYRNEEDVVQQFIDEICTIDCSGQSNKTELYMQCQTWCARSGYAEYEHRSQKWFTQQLTRQGYSQCGHGRQLISGLKIERRV